jgi:type IV secretion system protein VirD4
VGSLKGRALDCGHEFALDQVDEMEEDAPRIGRMSDLMQGVARQASLDPGDDLGL